MKKSIFLPIVFIPFLIFISCEKKVVEVRYAPVLYDLVAPDSIQRNSPDIHYVFVSVYDPDGPDDIDSVYFRVTRPDGSLKPDPIPLRDDGQYGDSTADDGRFSVGLSTYNDTTSLLGNYIFTFYAKDKQGDMSNNPRVTVTEY
jgi:hypothetical protein